MHAIDWLMVLSAHYLATLTLYRNADFFITSERFAENGVMIRSHNNFSRASVQWNMQKKALGSAETHIICPSARPLLYDNHSFQVKKTTFGAFRAEMWYSRAIYNQSTAVRAFHCCKISHSKALPCIFQCVSPTAYSHLHGNSTVPCNSISWLITNICSP